MVALELLLNTPVVTLKVAEEAAAATVTDPGIVKAESLFDNTTLAPPAGAFPFSFTVQVELLELPRLAGEHDNELTEGQAPPVTTPPVEVSAVVYPRGDAAKLLLIGMGVVVAPTANTRFTTATVPFEMIPESDPDTIQLYVPTVPEQLRVLEALVDAAPAVAEIETTFAVGYVNVH
jgi:hypothetical protein